jgi:sulfur relay protein TusB/DsrH
MAACLRLAAPGDGLLLLAEGVYAAQAGTAVASALGGHPGLARYALAADLAARGIVGARLAEGVLVVDDVGFVRLTLAYDRVMDLAP